MNKALRFSILTCLISWAIAAVFFLCGGVFAGPAKYIFGSAYMFIPMLTAMGIQKFYDKTPLKSTALFSLKVNKWWITAWLLLPAICFLSIFLSSLHPDIRFSWTMEGVMNQLSTLPPKEMAEAKMRMQMFTPGISFVLMLVSALFSGITINALVSFGEEYGWRNYLVYALKDYTIFKTSLFIGFVWGLWHFPLILFGGLNYPHFPIAGIFMMIIFCICLSPLMIYFTVKTKSVLVAAIMHGTLNASAGFGVVYLIGGNELLNGMPGLFGCLALVIVTAIFFIYDKYITKENIFSKKITESLHKENS